MEKYERDVSLTELQALFFSNNGTMTSANRASYEVLFSKLSKEERYEQRDSEGSAVKIISTDGRRGDS